MGSIEPHTITLPEFTPLEKHREPSPDLARSIVSDWLNDFFQLVTEPQPIFGAGTPSLFRADSWLRDMLVFSWDLQTIAGRCCILEYLAHGLETRQMLQIAPRAEGSFQPGLKRISPTLYWIESMFDFQTTIGGGSGIVRLVPGEEEGRWEAYAVSFTLQELKGTPEAAFGHRPYGQHGTNKDETWSEKRAMELSMPEDPQVVIIGAGQAGLSLGARLRALGVSHLILDHGQRVGDSWRQRYRTLVMHDPIHFRHMPFVPFPPTWPTFTPKDKMADFFETYVNLMELNVWMNSRIGQTTFDEGTRSWTVEVHRGGSEEPRLLHPRHVVLATGLAGHGIIPDLPGRDQFEGTVYHASQHKDASAVTDVHTKKVVVVGSGNSGHDICEDYHQYGAKVHMIQRGGTYVTRDGLSILNNLYTEGGPPLEDADLYSHSLPLPVQFALSVQTTRQLAIRERELLTQLTAAGFKLDFCNDGSGMIRKWLTRGGGYYVDRGGSQLIVDRKIALHQCPGGIRQFTSDGLILDNDTKVEADIVVFATGYERMKSTARKIFGDRVADRLGEEWDLDGQGEINAMWRPSGHPNFWYMGGTFGWCRSFSRILALQIKAELDGISAGAKL